MSELANAMQIVKGLALNVIKYPSGKYGFVGRVPMELAYVHADGSMPTPSEQKEIAEACNRGMVCKSLGIKTRVFDTENQARFAAARAGYEVVN
jgi:hypothetical protein